MVDSYSPGVLNSKSETKFSVIVLALTGIVESLDSLELVKVEFELFRRDSILDISD